MTGETMHKFMGLALAAGLLAAPAAEAATRGSISGEEIAAVLRAAGATEVTAGQDDSGDPTVVATMQGAQFQVLMYDCDEQDRCTSVQFRSGYDLSDGMTLETLNEWNASMRYGNAWLDDVDDPYIELDLDLTGSSDEQVSRYVDVWSAMMTRFQDFIGY